MRDIALTIAGYVALFVGGLQLGYSNIGEGR
jgi:hypothetical protein